MKKNLPQVTIVILMLLIAIIACKKTISIKGIRLDKTSVLLYVGDNLTLNAHIIPNDATNKVINWTSNDTTVVMLDNLILPLAIRAIGKNVGEAKITVTTQDGSHTATCDVVVTMPAIPKYYCNGNLPGWGGSLGVVNFASNHEWKIINDTITQIWSDAITATRCQKTSFNGGDWSNLNADCRSNPDYPGDFFSWCAIMRFAEQLCPAPWRIPTVDDFINLDIALGGTGRSRTDDTIILAKYINLWGGFLGGYCNSVGDVEAQSLAARYWSQTSRDNSVFHLIFTSSDFTPSARIIPNLLLMFKMNGQSLRCVRDNN